MAQPLPDHPNLRGGYAPLQMECDAPDLIVEGEVPRELSGTFYRNGPNPQFAPRAGYHWFAGDGMIHAFDIEDGKVSYKNRWVRTVKWQLERQAGESLFNPFNPMDTDPRAQGVESDGLANTNIVWHAGKLLALEEAHAPFELDPYTLESVGPWTFDGKLKGPMTAHPKIDPATGEMFFFAYSADGLLSDQMAYHVVDAQGRLTHSQTFTAPYASMVHDFIVTEDYVIFPIMPLVGSLERAMEGGPAFAWEPERLVEIGVMPRYGDVSEIRWFKGDPAYVFHPMNAHSEGGVVTCDVCEFERAPLFPLADGSRSGDEPPVARLTRWTLDMSSETDSYKHELLDDMPCEFPRLDERYSCRDYRYGYFACDTRSEPENGAFNGIGRVDHQTGRTQVYDVGPGCGTNEPVFVPRTDDAEEGDGFLLANVYDENRRASHLVILDAQNVADGPLATAYLDHRVPYGFHGNWRQNT